MAEKGLVSLVSSVVTPNDQFFASFGWRDPANKIKTNEEALYYIGSISKTFTAISVLQLIEQGKLSFSSTVDQFIENVPTKIVGDYESFLRLPKVDSFRSMTVLDLLTHTGGLDEKTLGMFAMTADSTESLEKLFNPEDGNLLKHGMARRVRQPATVASYSNTGINILGFIVEKVSGKKFETYVQENIINKISKMTATYPSMTTELDAVFKQKFALPFIRSDYDMTAMFSKFSNVVPAGGIISNLKDMTEYARTLIKKGIVSAPDVSLFKSTETFDSMITPKFFGYFPAMKNFTSMGYVFWLEQKAGMKTFGHDGAITPYFATLTVFPEQEFAIVSLMTGSTPQAVNNFIPVLAEYITYGYPSSLNMSAFCTNMTANEAFIRETGTQLCFEKKNLLQMMQNTLPISGELRDFEETKTRYHKYEGCYATTRRIHTSYLKLWYNIITKPIKIENVRGEYLKMFTGSFLDEFFNSVLPNPKPQQILVEKDPKAHPGNFELAIVSGGKDKNVIFFPKSDPFSVSFHERNGDPLISNRFDDGLMNGADYLRTKQSFATYERVSCFWINFSLVAFAYVCILSCLCCLLSLFCWSFCCIGDSVLNCLIHFAGRPSENTIEAYYKVSDDLNDANEDDEEIEPIAAKKNNQDKEDKGIYDFVRDSKKKKAGSGLSSFSRIRDMLFLGLCTGFGILLSFLAVVFGVVPGTIQIVHYIFLLVTIFGINSGKSLQQTDVFTQFTFLLPILSIAGFAFFLFFVCIGLSFVKFFVVVLGRRGVMARLLGVCSMCCSCIGTLPMIFGFSAYVVFLAWNNALLPEHYY